MWPVIIALLLAAEPFWNAKPPAEWSIEQVIALLRDSPWATVTQATAGPGLRVHIASAAPMREAEARERQARRFRESPGQSFEDYEEMLATGKYIALAVALKDSIPTSDAIEMDSLQRDSVLHIGRRNYKLITYFPPTSSDPYLRYLFARDVKPGDKAFIFDIYVPGIPFPQRHLEFDLREMKYQGKPAY